LRDETVPKVERKPGEVFHETRRGTAGTGSESKAGEIFEPRPARRRTKERRGASGDLKVKLRRVGQRIPKEMRL